MKRSTGGSYPFQILWQIPDPGLFQDFRLASGQARAEQRCFSLCFIA